MATITMFVTKEALESCIGKKMRVTMKEDNIYEGYLWSVDRSLTFKLKNVQHYKCRHDIAAIEQREVLINLIDVTQIVEDKVIKVQEVKKDDEVGEPAAKKRIVIWVGEPEKKDVKLVRAAEKEGVQVKEEKEKKDDIQLIKMEEVWITETREGEDFGWPKRSFADGTWWEEAGD